MLENVAETRQRLTDLVMALPVELRKPFVDISPEVAAIWDKMEEQQNNEERIEKLKQTWKKLMDENANLASRLTFYTEKAPQKHEEISRLKNDYAKLKKEADHLASIVDQQHLELRRLKRKPKPPTAPKPPAKLTWLDKVRRTSVDILD